MSKVCISNYFQHFVHGAFMVWCISGNFVVHVFLSESQGLLRVFKLSLKVKGKSSSPKIKKNEENK
jgi:hypothetical protein